MPRSRSFLPIAHALRTCVRKFQRSSSLPMADPPPVGGHTGATSDPTAKPFDAILSARRFRSESRAAAQRLGVRIAGTEVLQDDERIGLAPVLDANAGARSVFGDEQFVFGHLSVSNHRGRGDGELSENAVALDDDEAVRSGVCDDD